MHAKRPKSLERLDLHTRECRREASSLYRQLVHGQIAFARVAVSDRLDSPVGVVGAPSSLRPAPFWASGVAGRKSMRQVVESHCELSRVTDCTES
jgi:hypothetical protein